MLWARGNVARLVDALRQLMNQQQFPQQAAGISAELAARWYPHITAAMSEFGITVPLIKGHVHCSGGHESAGFTRLVESFNYSIAGLTDSSAPENHSRSASPVLLGEAQEKALPLERRAIANLAYSKRMGNNGPRRLNYYCGRAYQITGLNNYRDCGNGSKSVSVSHPILPYRYAVCRP